MTIAVCTRCGAKNVGAFTACRACGFDPETPEEMARSLLLSDHNLPRDQLEAVARKIRAGEPIPFDEAACAGLAEDLRRHPEWIEVPLGCTIIPWVLVILMALLAIAVLVVCIPR